MAEIERGYDGKATYIKVGASDSGQAAEVWIEQEGLKEVEGASHSETLAYASIGELIALRDEINTAIKKLAGV